MSISIGNETANDRDFDGLIDEVRIYNRALSANEIQTLYNIGATTKFNVSPTKYLTDGLVGYWTMDGSNVNWKTGAVTDSSARGNTGTITNMATSTGVAIGKIGQALKFDGVDDYVKTPNGGSLNKGPFTISVWSYVTGENAANAIYIFANMSAADACCGPILFGSSNITGGNGLRLNVDLVNGPFRQGCQVTCGATDSSFKKNQWEHIVATWDGSLNYTGIHLYKKGVEIT